MMDYAANGGKLAVPYSAGQVPPTTNTLDGAFLPSNNNWSPEHRGRRVSDIIDGTSNTVLIGEKFINKSQVDTNLDSSHTCDEDQGWVDGWDNDAVSSALGYQVQSMGILVPQRSNMSEIDVCGGLFGSFHAAAIVVFCDGSVHTISFSIDPNNWLHLLQINDGLILTRDGID